LISKKASIALLLIATLIVILVGVFIKPIPQPQAYHNFANQRSWLGIDNAWNVLSNSAFALVGIGGLYLLLSPGKVQFTDQRERWLWIAFSVGLVLTAIGSSYYHLAPDNSRLVRDRLPMIIIFMSYVAALISERINVSLGLWLWPLLLCVGFYSVLLWKASEELGVSDLRFYIGVQGFTILVTLVMLLAPSPYSRNSDLAIVVILYGLAILCEIFDHQIYALSSETISGHNLKHFVTALAGAWLIRMIWKRKIIVPKGNLR